MSYQKLNPNRAWTVTPSDFAPLPVYMSEVITQPNNTDFFFSGLLISDSINFVSVGVSPGDVVVGAITGSSATVVDVYINRSHRFSNNFKKS